MKKKIVLSGLLTLMSVIALLILSSCSDADKLVLTYLEESDSYAVSGVVDTDIKKVTVPSEYNGRAVTEIASGAFDECYQLETIMLPDGLTSIGSSVFEDTAFYNDPDNWEDGVLYIGRYLITVRESVKFCSVQEGTVLIANGAFSSTKITSLIIPEGVERIGQYAFAYCNSLSEITLPQSVTQIGLDAFLLTSGLLERKVNISSLEAWLRIEFEGGISNPLYEGGELYINGKLVTEITIPDSITRIGYSAFLGYEPLNKITMHNGVTEVGDFSFSDCANLSEITLSDALTSIGRYAFDACGLSSVTLPEGVTQMGEYAFRNCKKLTQITIPQSVSSMGGWAFENCSSLTTVIYSGTVAEWNAIEKDWTCFSGIAKDARVICTDGEVEL